MPINNVNSKSYQVTESWRPNGNQTTLAVCMDPSTGVKQIDAWLPVAGEANWREFSMNDWGIKGASSGGDPTANWEQFHLDVPDTLPDGSQIDKDRLKAYGAALTVSDGSSSDWLPNTKVGGNF